MADICELLRGRITLEGECLDWLHRNQCMGPLATSGGLVKVMRKQLGKPIQSPVALRQVTERFREAMSAVRIRHVGRARAT